MLPIPDAATLDRLASLKKSERMPVLFLGHGSPMNALGDNEYRRSWQVLGAEFGSKLPRPQLILCISALADRGLVANGHGPAQDHP